MNAGAVAGLAIRVDGAAMPHGAEGIDPGLDHVPPRFAVEGGDKAYAAGIVFLGGGVGVSEMLSVLARGR
jgi:hypothetical protein